MEIERKFLLNFLPNLNNIKSVEIEQAYLPNGSRIRSFDNKYILTIKKGEGLIREEYEKEISQSLYFSILDNHIGNIIKKTRFFYPIDKILTAEIDIYHKSLHPLKSVEVEFPSVYEANNFAPPIWFGKEITNEKQYSNSQLAINGIPEVKQTDEIRYFQNYAVAQLKYDQKLLNLNFTNQKENSNCIKIFPTFDGNKIFKPISLQKPRVSELFPVAEVFASKAAQSLNLNHADYCLAECENLNSDNNLYLNKGALSDNFLNNDEKFVSLLDYFITNKNENIDLKNYINFAFCVYNFIPFFNEEPFKSNQDLSEGLANNLLFRTLIMDFNTHFGNVGFIKDREGQYKIAPIFDNEYSHLFMHLENIELHEQYKKNFNACENSLNRIQFIKQEFPKLFSNFKEKINNLKQDKKLLDICDFTSLKDYVPYINSKAYHKLTNINELKPASNSDFEFMSDFVYKQFNEQIDYLLQQ